MTESTYNKRLGWKLDNGQWGTRRGVVVVLPDELEDRSGNVQPLPPEVTTAISQYDGMIAL